MLQCVPMCCIVCCIVLGVLQQYVRVCCRGLQGVVLYHSVLQCAAVCCSVLQCAAVCCSVLQCAAVCCSVLWCAVVCCRVLPCAAVCCSVLTCVAMCCSALQCVPVCCNVLQCSARTFNIFVYNICSVCDTQIWVMDKDTLSNDLLGRQYFFFPLFLSFISFFLLNDLHGCEFLFLNSPYLCAPHKHINFCQKLERMSLFRSFSCLYACCGGF